MTCNPTRTPLADEIDIAALREKYLHERDKRMNSAGGTQYVQPKDDFADNYAHDPHMDVEPRDALSEDLDVAVLGAGWGGILAAYHLTNAGVSNFRNIDHAGDFGGVWYWNRYPGIQCDNDAYCYLPLLEETGFIPSQKFSNGAEIQGYCRQIAETFDFAEKALFHTLVTSVDWDERIQRWRIGTNRGDDIRARHVIMAAGVLNMPKLPGISGIDSFKGKMFHTARWDYAYTGGGYADPTLDGLKDKRVAIIGTGATSIQAVPHLAKYAKELYVVQRTPSSVDERPNPKTDPEWVKSLEPGWQKQRRDNFHRYAMEVPQPGEPDLICDIWTEINRNLAAKLAADANPDVTMEQFMATREVIDYQVMERLRRRVAEIVEDPQTAEALKPYYRAMCKRPLSSDDYYPVFNQPNVNLVDVSETKGVEAITEKGFVANGVEHEVDCLIFASGFEVSSDLERRWGIESFVGRDGQSIYDHWRQGPKTLHGLMTHGFPNQYYIGYIQGALNASVTEQFGEQGRHAAWIIAEALKQGVAVVEPTKEAQDGYVQHFADIEVDMSAFQRECTPSYFNNEGQVKAPWSLFRAYGHGWAAFQKVLSDWKSSGEMEGMSLTPAPKERVS
jgi:cation diffusion facilitator CzcD-associated flavoprotein CzcO